MQQEKIHSDILASAICNMSAGISLSNDEKQTYDTFINQNEYLKDIRIDSELMRMMAADKPAKLGSWSAFLEKNKQRLEQLEQQQQYIEHYQLRRKPRMHTGYKIAIAACLVALASILYHWFSPAHQPSFPASGTLSAHGGGRATLVLSENIAIRLDTVPNGQFAQQGNTRVLRTGTGQIAYQTNPNSKNEAPFNNSLMVPRGGTYALMLSDSSMVYLNAESSINYPASFDGNTREVTLVKGEAFFDIKHDKTNRPFVVITRGVRNIVLGTTFNISVYDNETRVKTTLLNGSLKVSSGKQEYLLRPGQQSVFQKNTDLLLPPQYVNTDKVIAWKNGFFTFDGEDLRTIMQQAERWYDVKAVFKDNGYFLKEGIHLSAFDRKQSLNTFMQVLSIDEKNFHYKINGNEVIISK